MSNDIQAIRERDEGERHKPFSGHGSHAIAIADRHTLLAEIDRLKAELKNAVEYNDQDFEVIESISKERDRLNAELADAQDGYTQLQEEYAETVAEARDLPDSIMLARAKATERARCIAAIEASCMICPECIVEAVKVIEADA